MKLTLFLLVLTAGVGGSGGLGLPAAGLAPPLPAAFQRKLTANKLRFTMPAGSVPAAAVANTWFRSDYTLRFPSRQVEVRYSIWPLGSILKEYRRTAGQPGADLLVDPNELYPTQAAVVLGNLSGGQTPELREFPPGSAKHDFGADWGAMAQVAPSREVAPGFKHCLLVALHRRDVADVYCVYLFQKQTDLDWLVAQPTPATAPIHALRFE